MTVSELEPPIEALRAAIAKAKLGAKFVRVLKELELIQAVLSASKSSIKENTKASLALRPGLVDLYKTFPSLTVSFTTTVLSVSHAKLLTAQAQKQTNVSERLESLILPALNGLLDFLEEQISESNKTIVANALFPLLDTIIFDSSNPPCKDDIIYLLFSILVETVNGHGANKTALRSKFNSGSHFSHLISRTKGYIVLEALLQLFSVLLPAKKFVDDRRSFIKNAFSPGSFPSSEEINSLLCEGNSKSSGEDLPVEILHALARSDISYPQPFNVEDFQTNSAKSRPITRLYVNHLGLLGNLEVSEDAIDTLNAFYSGFKNVQIASMDKGTVSVVITLTSLPTIGAAPGTPPPPGEDCTLSFVIKEMDKMRFIKALRSRGLGQDVLHEAIKLSRPESYVQFREPENADGPSSTQERVKDFSRHLWENDNTCVSGEASLPTSPLLLANAFVETVEELPSAQVPKGSKKPDAAKPSEALVVKPEPGPQDLVESIFGSDNDELTDMSDEEDAPARQSKLRGAVVIVKSDESRKERSNKSRKKTIIISDDEESQNPHVVESKHFKKPPLATSPKAVLPNVTPSTPSVPTREPSIQMVTPPETITKPNTRQQAKPAIQEDLKLQLEKKNVSATGKRKTTPDYEQIEERVSKRAKKEATLQPKEKSKPPLESVKPLAKRYGCKGRASSPIQIRDASPPPPRKTGQGVLLKAKEEIVKPKPRPVARANKNAREVENDVGSKKVSSTPGKAHTPLVIEGSPQPKGQVKELKPRAVTTKKTEMNDKNEKNIDDVQGKEKNSRSSKTPAQKTERAEKDNTDEAELEIVCLSDNSFPPNEKSSVEEKRPPSRSPATYLTKKSNIKPWKEKPNDSAPSKRISDRFPFRPINEHASPGPDMAQREDITIVPDDIEHHGTPNFHSLFDEIEPDHFPALKARRDLHLVQANSNNQAEPPRVPSPETNAVELPEVERHMTAIPRTALPPFGTSPGKQSLPVKKPVKRCILPTPSPFDTSAEWEIDDGGRYTRPVPAIVGIHSTFEHRPISSLPHQPEIPEIVGVIHEITKVIIDNTSKRFKNLRKELKTAQLSTIKDMTYELERIQVDSTEWSKKLEDIESSYASEHLKISHEWDAFSRVTEEMKVFLEKNLETRNRNSMSKKFPKTFFKASLPENVLHPEILF